MDILKFHSAHSKLLKIYISVSERFMEIRLDLTLFQILLHHMQEITCAAISTLVFFMGKYPMISNYFLKLRKRPQTSEITTSFLMLNPWQDRCVDMEMIISSTAMKTNAMYKAAFVLFHLIVL